VAVLGKDQEVSPFPKLFGRKRHVLVAADRRFPMRAVFAAALYLVLGACATFGGDGFDPYGTYDFVSYGRLGTYGTFIDFSKSWIELRADGTATFGDDRPELNTQLTFTLGEMEDGCFPIALRWPGDGEDAPGSICGDVYTVEESGGTLIFHKRR